jgi:serine/threonine protein kinase/DUF4097 and DUF4098 domain-containing protein YvlB
MNIEALVGKALGTCTLQSVIGRGELSIVFLAQQSRPRRQVAVKVLQPTLPVAPRQRAVILERLRYEIDVVASLEHPNIIQIHEYGEHHGLAYLVMPYINGGTLHNEIKRRGPLSLRRTVFYLEQMAAALDYAHRRGIIHYGIKPANILMGREGRLLLTDFGQLKYAANRSNLYQRSSKDGAAIGTPDYAAPEQLIGSDVDTSANQYSLGVILYQMVTGTVPFTGKEATQLQHNHPQSPRVFRPDLPVTAEQVMLKALAVQPTDRYLHVQAFARAFREALIAADIPLIDLGSMFVNAGLSDPHIPIPQRPSDTRQRQPHQTGQQQSPRDEQQQARQAMDNGNSDILIDTSPTIHIVEKKARKRVREDDAPIDTSPAIRKVDKSMLQHDQDDSVSSTDTSPTIHTVSKDVHKDDIVARTRLTLPSLTSFLSPSPFAQPAEQETPPAMPALKPVPAPSPVQSAKEQEPNLLEGLAEPDAQLPTTESRVQAVPKARIHPMPAMVPEAAEMSREALIEQVATIPPVNRPVERAKLPSVAQTQQAATSSPIEKPAGRARRPARRASLFFLALVVLLVIAVLGIFAYMASTHNLPPKSALPSEHHSAKNINTTSIYAKPGSRSFHVEAALQLVIKGEGSNVTIHTGNADTVTVTASMQGNNPTQTANNTTIQYMQSVDKRGDDHLSVTANPPGSNIDYNITAPAATQVRIEVESGSITVDGINRVNISTESGNLDIENINGPVQAHTVNGSITAHAINGQVRLGSVNGSIRADNINGPLQATTRNGDIVVKQATLHGQSALETTNGSVYFDGTLDPQGAYKMMTNRGNINLTLPANAAFQLEASTYSGSIYNAFKNTEVGTTPRAMMIINIGNGGSITISKAA